MLLRNKLEQELKSFILENFTCDIDTGKCYRKHATTDVGTVTTTGYVNVYIKKVDNKAVRLRAHRVVWLFAHGDFPEGYIDHIDGNKQNNSISIQNAHIVFIKVHMHKSRFKKP
jgi:hypothetical protein